MKTTCKKSRPVNLSQVLNLTLTPASRLNGVIILKRPYISLSIGARASEYKNILWDVLVSKCFACEQFWPHFEKQNGRHSQLFENH